jgi:hypothetical protein
LSVAKKWKHLANAALYERHGFTAIEEDEGTPAMWAERPTVYSPRG